MYFDHAPKHMIRLSVEYQQDSKIPIRLWKSLVEDTPIVLILFKFKKNVPTFPEFRLYIEYMFNTIHSYEIYCNVCFIALSCDYQQRLTDPC